MTDPMVKWLLSRPPREAAERPTVHDAAVEIIEAAARECLAMYREELTQAQISVAAHSIAREAVRRLSGEVDHQPR